MVFLVFCFFSMAALPHIFFVSNPHNHQNDNHSLPPAHLPPTSQRRPPHDRVHQLARRPDDADDPGGLHRLLRAAGRRRPRRAVAQGVLVPQGALLLLEGRDGDDDTAAAAERGAVCLAAGSS